MPESSWDYIVIGGGAAGYFSAITYAEHALQHTGQTPRVLILEKSAHVLGKVKISGGGRCNLTHACLEPKELIQHYPRGNKSLIGSFHHWGVADTVEWFESHGVPLKTEEDGRMFPVSNQSESVIYCLTNSAKQLNITTHTSEGVTNVKASENNTFDLTTDKNKTYQTKALLIATGGTRLTSGGKLAASLGHKLIPNVPSLFAFNINDPRITALPGISVQHVEITSPNIKKLSTSGAALITHHGLSGPSILKFSAWGARELHALDYRFKIHVDWIPHINPSEIISQQRQESGKRQLLSHSPFTGIPKRLWQSLCSVASVPTDCTWAQLDKATSECLCKQLSCCAFSVTGKSINKDEFVTCGGVHLRDVNLKTMESKISPNLYFAGEILDIDGVTGGFNFQNAWTTGYIAGNSASFISD